MTLVCLSVCLCLLVTSPCSTKTTEHGITQTAPHDSAGTPVPKILGKFHRSHPAGSSWLNAQVCYTLVDCNPLTPLLQFVLVLS